jgi:hypothetical protein
MKSGANQFRPLQPDLSGAESLLSLLLLSEAPGSR